jgi:hypothetical protein
MFRSQSPFLPFSLSSSYSLSFVFTSLLSSTTYLGPFYVNCLCVFRVSLVSHAFQDLCLIDCMQLRISKFSYEKLCDIPFSYFIWQCIHRLSGLSHLSGNIDFLYEIWNFHSCEHLYLKTVVSNLSINLANHVGDYTVSNLEDKILILFNIQSDS